MLGPCMLVWITISAYEAKALLAWASYLHSPMGLEQLDNIVMLSFLRRSQWSFAILCATSHAQANTR